MVYSLQQCKHLFLHRTLLCFEQYIFTECGPKSQPNINYQLWKLLRTLEQTTEHKKRDSLAVHIYQNFLYLGAKRFLHLPDSLLGEIDNKVEMARPSSSTLKELSEFSSTSLQSTIKKFITKSQDFSSNKSLDSLPPLQYLKNSRRKKVMILCLHIMWIYIMCVVQMQVSLCVHIYCVCMCVCVSVTRLQCVHLYSTHVY